MTHNPLQTGCGWGHRSEEVGSKMGSTVLFYTPPPSQESNELNIILWPPADSESS